MTHRDFTFKAKWLKDAEMNTLDWNWIVTAIVKYGVMGIDISKRRKETYASDMALAKFEKIKKDIDTQFTKPPKKEKMKIPPAIEEVVQYVNDKGLGIDPYQWWNFYNAKDWFIGRNKMKNWHSAIATWVKRNQVNYYAGQQQSNVINKVADILAD